jgi:hypothetical protein
VQLEPIGTADTFDLSRFAKRLIERLIEAARHDPAEMKHRIMVAWADGHLTAQEAEDWIVLAGLESA